MNTTIQPVHISNQPYKPHQHPKNKRSSLQNPISNFSPNKNVDRKYVPKQTKPINTTTTTTVAPSVDFVCSPFPMIDPAISILDIKPSKLLENQSNTLQFTSSKLDAKLQTTFDNHPSSPIAGEKMETMIQPKQTKRYEKEFILALRNKPICLQRPEGRLPSEIMKEYNQEYEKQDLSLSLSGSLSLSCSLSDQFQNVLEKQIQDINIHPVKSNKSNWQIRSQGSSSEGNFNNLRHSVPTGSGTTHSFKKQSKQEGSFDNLRHSVGISVNGTTHSFKKQPSQKYYQKLVRSSQNEEEWGSGESDDDEPSDEKSLPKVINGNQIETNPRRLETRQRQIDIGMNTPGYQRFIEVVPHPKKGDPQLPNKLQVCSKRSWDGQIRKWRRMLHRYDPEPTAKS